MIKSKNDLKNYLDYEKNIYLKGKQSRIKAMFQIGEESILWKHIVLLRKCEYYVNTKKKLRGFCAKMRLQRFQNKYALHIPINTCECGLSIAHVGPIVINKRAIIGKNARIHMGVNVGTSKDNEAPHIGDDVYFGPGAKVFGSITLASNITIGANAVVNRSCDIAGALLVGIPAKVKSNLNEEN